jgi:hypothetical protein
MIVSAWCAYDRYDRFALSLGPTAARRGHTTGEQRLRHVEAERFGDSQIDHHHDRYSVGQYDQIMITEIKKPAAKMIAGTGSIR